MFVVFSGLGGVACLNGLGCIVVDLWIWLVYCFHFDLLIWLSGFELFLLIGLVLFCLLTVPWLMDCWCLFMVSLLVLLICYVTDVC